MSWRLWFKSILYAFIFVQVGPIILHLLRIDTGKASSVERVFFSWAPYILIPWLVYSINKTNSSNVKDNSKASSVSHNMHQANPGQNKSAPVIPNKPIIKPSVVSPITPVFKPSHQPAKTMPAHSSPEMAKVDIMISELKKIIRDFFGNIFSIDDIEFLANTIVKNYALYLSAIKIRQTNSDDEILQIHYRHIDQLAKAGDVLLKHVSAMTLGVILGESSVNEEEAGLQFAYLINKLYPRQSAERTTVSFVSFETYLRAKNGWKPIRKESPTYSNSKAKMATAVGLLGGAAIVAAAYNSVRAEDSSKPPYDYSFYQDYDDDYDDSEEGYRQSQINNNPEWMTGMDETEEEYWDHTEYD